MQMRFYIDAIFFQLKRIYIETENKIVTAKKKANSGIKSAVISTNDG